MQPTFQGGGFLFDFPVPPALHNPLSAPLYSQTLASPFVISEPLG